MTTIKLADLANDPEMIGHLLDCWHTSTEHGDPHTVGLRKCGAIEIEIVGTARGYVTIDSTEESGETAYSVSLLIGGGADTIADAVSMLLQAVAATGALKKTPGSTLTVHKGRK